MFLLFCLGLLTALVIFYFPWLSGRWSFYLSDLTYYYEPFCRYIGDALKHQHLPAWNPYYYCGMPQIAIPSPGIFYPPDWLFAALPFSRALAIYMIIHQMAAGIGGFLLVSALGWGGFAAATCGITLAAGNYMFSLQKNFSLVASAAWLPLSIWSMQKIGWRYTASQCLWIVGASICIFLTIAAGRPEITLPSLLFTAGFICLSAFCAYRDDKLRTQSISQALCRLFACGLGIALAMPVILPALEWTALSPRAGGLRPEQALLWSTNWYDCLTLFIAQPLGDLNLIGAKFLPVVATRPGYIPFLASAYLGPFILSLAIYGICDRQFRGRWLLAFVLVSGLTGTLGSYTPVVPWLMQRLQLLSIFRYPVKLLIVPVWCITLLAARGAYLLACGRMPHTFTRWAVCAFWSSALVLSLVFANTPNLGWIAAQLSLAPPAVNVALISQALVALGQGGLRSAMQGLFGCLVVELYCRNKLSAASLAAIFVACIAATQLSCAWFFSRSGCEANYFNHDSYAGKLIDKLSLKSEPASFRILPLYFDPLTLPPWYRGQTLESTTARFYQYARQALLPNTNSCAHLYSAFGYEAAETADYRAVFESVYKPYQQYCSNALNGTTDQQAEITALVPLARFCQMTAVRWLSTQVFVESKPGQEVPRLPAALFTLQVEDRAFNLRIYELNDKLSRVYLAPNWRWLDNHKQAIACAKDPLACDFDPGKILLLEHASQYASRRDPRPQAAQNGTGRAWVQIMQSNPEHISLSVRAAQSSFLVLSDHYYPGWQAAVDGVPAQIYRANALLKAVYVKPGSHLVQFDYEPDSLNDGFRLAGLAGIFILFLAASSIYIKLAESVSPARQE